MPDKGPTARSREIFEAAIEIEADTARSRYVREACAGDSTLLQSVLNLLQACEAAQSFFPEAALEPGTITGLGEKPGDQVGRYRLLEEIGVGGCGVVFLAEQLEPVRRQVALKVIKVGMDTRSVVSRFEAERQTLAMMDHPNIAKVLDAGATINGRPFFVMELVAGLRITDHCQQHQLPATERLRLFASVCRAVQHAHQKGIIHRDLKPSNVLVSSQDGVAVPKVIDFGIAKAVEEPLADQTRFTRPGSFVGTPAYISPEQAEWSGVNTDTRTDIYSLGVLLYELLTGETPFDTRALIQAGVDEWRRTIREVMPMRPSTRVSRRSAGARQSGEDTSVLRRREDGPGPEALSPIDPRQWVDLLKGDLDCIVMKCLEKDPARRYETANGLAQDIRRYLEHEPVTARPSSRWYYFTKMVRRNQGTFLALTTVAILLIAGVAVSSWQAVRARRAEKAEKSLLQIAQRSERAARAAHDQARLQAYTSDMKSAVSALQASNVGQAQDLLRRYFPQPGERDLRGIEWRFAWEAARGDELRTFRQDHFVNCVRLSPKGQVLAMTTFAGEGRLTEVASGQILARFAVPREKEMVDLLAFSPDGKMFAACTPTGLVLRDTGNWQMRHTLAGRCDAVAFSRDSGTLAVTDDTGVRLYNASTGEPRGTIAAPGAGVGYLAFARDGQQLAFLRLPGSSVGLWDVATLQKTAEFSGIQGARRMIVSPNGRWLAVGNIAGELLMWDLLGHAPVLKQKLHTRWLFAMAFSPDGQTLATGGGDQVIQLWDTSALPQSKLEGRATLRGHRSEVWSLAFSGDGGMLVSGSKDRTVKLWRTTSPPAPVTQLNLPRGGALLLGFMPETKQALMLPPEENELQVWDTLTSQLTRRVPVRPAGAVIFNAPYVFFGTTNGTAEIWHAPAGERVRAVQLARGPIMALGGSADRKFLLGWDTTHEQTALWNLETSDRVAAFPDFATEMASGSWRKSQRVAFSPDGRWLAYASTNYTVKIRDLLRGAETFTLRGHAWHIDCLRFSADSSRLASGSWDAEARVWDVATGREAMPPLRGHLSGIGTVSFSPDGRTLAVWSGENLHFWSLENGAEMLSIPNVTAWFFNVIASDGSALVWEEGAFSGNFRIRYLTTLAAIDRSEQSR